MYFSVFLPKQLNSISQKKGNLKFYHPIFKPFLNVLQQNKFVLMLLERGQVPKAK